jgi:hypothetical protein
MTLMNQIVQLVHCQLIALDLFYHNPLHQFPQLIAHVLIWWDNSTSHECYFLFYFHTLSLVQMSKFLTYDQQDC